MAPEHDQTRFTSFPYKSVSLSVNLSREIPLKVLCGHHLLAGRGCMWSLVTASFNLQQKRNPSKKGMIERLFTHMVLHKLNTE